MLEFTSGATSHITVSLTTTLYSCPSRYREILIALHLSSDSFRSYPDPQTQFYNVYTLRPPSPNNIIRQRRDDRILDPRQLCISHTTEILRYEWPKCFLVVKSPLVWTPSKFSICTNQYMTLSTPTQHETLNYYSMTNFITSTSSRRWTLT